MAASAKRVTNSYKCGYCCRLFPQLVDPRTLPCLHVYCLPCLETDILLRQTCVRCSYCKTVHDITDVMSLPKSDLNDPLEEEVEVKTDIVYCDLCKKTPTKAVTFCVESQKKLCQQHMQFAEAYMGGQHQFVQIKEYKQAPDKYVCVKCTDHPNHQLSEACSVCLTQFCIRCDTNSVCKDITGISRERHTVQSLTSLSNELKNVLEEKSKVLSNKIVELANIEKEAWNELSEVEDKAEQMFLTVNRITEKKIAAIRKESNELKKEIQAYFDATEQKVEEFEQHTLEKWSEMQGLWNSTQEMINGYNNSDIVSTFRERAEELEEAQDISMIHPCALPRKTLVPTTSKVGYLGQKLLRIPKPTDFTPTLQVTDDRKQFLTANIAVDGRVLCETKSNIEIRDPDTLNIIKSVSNTPAMHWWEIIQPFDFMIGQCHNVREELNEVVLLNPDSLERMCTIYKRDKFDLYQLAQCGSNVYMVNSKNKLLVVCPLTNNKCVLKLPIPGMVQPVNICALPDSTILIGDLVENGAVVRYRLDKAAGQLTELWKIPHVEYPTGIAYDDGDELIYVCSRNGPILVVSLEGTVLQSIPYDDLGVSGASHMTISAGRLFLCTGADKLRGYTLTY